MAKYSAIWFSDLKRTIGKMRFEGMSEGQVMQQVLYCLQDIDMAGDE